MNKATVHCVSGTSVTSTVRTTTTRGEDVPERSAEIGVEDGVEKRVDGGVGVAEPEEERVEPARYIARGTPAAQDVDDEEAEPHTTEHDDDDSHAHRHDNLTTIHAVTAHCVHIADC